MTGIKTQSPRHDGSGDSPTRDEILKRMLKMKPKPQKPVNRTTSKRKSAKAKKRVVE